MRPTFATEHYFHVTTLIQTILQFPVQARARAQASWLLVPA
eukprot:COSAG02_NODE_49222_length_328_cov_0.724891_1_plen_40_part_10